MELQQALAYMVANLCKREQEEKKITVEKLKRDQEVILKLLTFKHNSKAVFTSRTPSRRDHHGYTRG